MSIRGLADVSLDSLFFTPTIANLYDPFLFVQMKKAVLRIKKAIENKERMVIFGDYDVDGISSTALLVRFLQSRGAQVSYRIPEREADGYGMKSYFIDELSQKGVSLIVTVDCGTRDEEVIAHAATLGIDVIVTDHHVLPPEAPASAFAFINPQDPKSGYPWPSLSGSGVAFKLLHALALEMCPNEDIETILSDSVDIAMLGTIADCMPLLDENRTIAMLGLRQIRQSSMPLLQALSQTRPEMDELDSDLIAYYLGPLINSAGRMRHPYIALQALLSTNGEVEKHIANITATNSTRKIATETYMKKALREVDSSRSALVYSSPQIEHGVVGIIAGKLNEVFNRPSFVFRENENEFVGSARAPEYFDLMVCIDQLSDFFTQYGGHSQAAGMTIPKEKFEAFLLQLETIASAQIGDSDTTKYTDIDTVLRLPQINFGLIEQINQLKPFGMGNKKPVFLIEEFAPSRVEYLGKDCKHLKFRTPYPDVDINAFGWGEHYEKLADKKLLDLVVEMDTQVWQGRKKISVNVRDIVKF